MRHLSGRGLGRVAPTWGLILAAGLLVAVVAAGFSSRVAAAEASRVGVAAPEFDLRDSYGKAYRLDDFADSKLVVVAFLGTDCPLVKLYAPRLNELAAEYASRGVAFVGINSNRQDPITKIGAYARRHEISFPILKDPDNTIADQFGALRTPEVFVLDADRVVRYWGRIDDQYGVGVQRAEPTRRDLATALDELLAGQSVSQPITDAPGCLIGRLPRVEPHGDVTYSNQVSRILQQRCVNCHRPGEIGPFPLTTYDEVVGWSDMIREVVSEGRMPPWFADPAHGKYSNDARLTPTELEQLYAWIDHGSPEGDPADLPEPLVYAEGWQIPEPDAVFYMSDEPYTVQAEGVVDYQYFTVDPGFTEDKWVRIAEARPGNRAVVHHIIAFFQPPGGGDGLGASRGGVAGYAPGMPPARFPEGVAIRVPAGSKLVFQMHYTPVGTEQQDRSCVGMVFADPSEVRREADGGMAGNVSFRIPPGASDHPVTSRKRFRKDTLLLSLTPHMHVRGKSFRYELEYPDGRREVLLNVPRYDFNWQLRYDLAEPVLVPKGSELHCYATFDNSEDNPFNPDPTAEVRFGEQTWEEMMFGFYMAVDPYEDRLNSETDEPADEAPRTQATVLRNGN